MSKEPNRDLFGNIIETNLLLRDKFIEPPFSIIDTKTGRWQTRKDRWKALGIESEIGRGDSMTYNIPTGNWEQENMQEEYYGEEAQKLNTSIFDPALCELMYRWFCPDGGKILDPFAGGSVRGIVANYLGYNYCGIELSKEQVLANREQAEEIVPDHQPIWWVGDTDKILDEEDFLINNINVLNPPQKKKTINISVKSLKQKFQPCEPEYIKSVCHGRCCEGTNKLVITVHDTEEERIKGLGGTVVDGFIQDPGTGLCPFKGEDSLCTIHNDKPFGCKVSPFTLTIKDTLIIRNRYRMLRCYNTPDAVPVYIAHRWSLVQIFGEKEVVRIIKEIEAGKEEIQALIDYNKYTIIQDNDIAKHPDRESVNPMKYDFIFSCPPYLDLEVYSDDPNDLSTMNDNDFEQKYYSIISKSTKLLKSGGYACFVVGDVRDKKTGFYRDFMGMTKRVFQRAGLGLYNEAVLLNSIASASMRANRQFQGGKKLVKIHQNVLIFKKP